MKKLLFILLLILVGCADSGSNIPFSGRPGGFNRVGILCINGHEYYAFDRGIAIRLTDFGIPVKCEIKN